MGYPEAWKPIATTASTSYTGSVPSNLQSAFFVVTGGVNRKESVPSNLAGAPSYKVPNTLATANSPFMAMMRRGADQKLVRRVRNAFKAAEVAASHKNYGDAEELMITARAGIDQWVTGSEIRAAQHVSRAKVYKRLSAI